jgi:hypothetical protein
VLMRVRRLGALMLLTASLGACAAKAQVRAEVELPLIEPPPPPPRVVTIYQEEPEPAPLAPVVEPVPARPVRSPQPPATRPEPPVVPEAPPEVVKPAPPSLTLTPTPGSESQTVVAIRDLMARATRDLARVNAGALNADGRAQVEAARRFLEQADEALKARNVVFAGKLADKAATMAAVLVR